MRPNGNTVKIKSLARTGCHDFLIGNISVLGDNEIASIDRNKNALEITLSNAPKTDLPLCFKIEIE
jgi:hypothetical protein